MSQRPAIVLREVKKWYPVGDGRSLEVLNVEQLAVPAARCTVLRGRSGSGKTTLLNLIAGIAIPSAGMIEVGGTDILALPEARRDRFRAEHIGYVFQNFNLLAAFSALENVILAMTFAGSIAPRLRRRRAAELLDRLGLAARVGHKPDRLSRGEQQRVAIARALANDPPLILADEPCASLDATTAAEVIAVFVALCRQDGRALLLVSHEEAAFGAADRILDMAALNRAEAGATAA
jgi:putative ABC transport system ATP-binding protein